MVRGAALSALVLLGGCSAGNPGLDFSNKNPTAAEFREAWNANSPGVAIDSWRSSQGGDVTAFIADDELIIGYDASTGTAKLNKTDEGNPMKFTYAFVSLVQLYAPDRSAEELKEVVIDAIYGRSRPTIDGAALHCSMPSFCTVRPANRSAVAVTPQPATQVDAATRAAIAADAALRETEAADEAIASEPRDATASASAAASDAQDAVDATTLSAGAAAAAPDVADTTAVPDAAGTAAEEAVDAAEMMAREVRQAQQERLKQEETRRAEQARAAVPAQLSLDRKAKFRDAKGYGYAIVRSAPSNNADVVAKVGPEDVFYSQPQAGEWWQVKTSDGRIGYMEAESLRLL